MKKKFNVKDYLPIFILLFCAVTLGTLMACGIVDIKKILDMVQDRPGAAFIMSMILFALKGISGVILYDALALMIAAIFRFPFSLITLLAGTAISLSVSYLIGLRTNTERLKQILSRKPKIEKYFDVAKEYGGVASVVLHMLGLNMEVLGVLFGALRQNYFVYFLSSVIGLAPCMLSMLVIGSSGDVSSVKFWLMIAVYALCAVAALFYAKHLAKKKRKRKTSDKSEKFLKFYRQFLDNDNKTY